MKTVLITGSNRGIGLEIAKEMAALGWQVIATARNLDALKVSLTDVDGHFLMHSLDVTNKESIKILSKFLQENNIQIDALVNNAGIGVAETTAIHPDFDAIRKEFEVNFFGVWQVCSGLLAHLKSDYNACIINISSGMGAWDDLKGGSAGYRLSKNALNSLSYLLSNELKKSKIKVHSMCPGWVKTDMGGEMAPRTVEKGAETAVYLATTEGIPTGRFWRDKRPISW